MGPGGGERAELILASLPPTPHIRYPQEVTLWEHSSNSPNKSLDGSGSASPGDQADAPYLVQALALLQLRSLQEGASLASLASEAAASVAEGEAFDVVVDGKPLQIATFESPLPSPTPSPRRPPKTSSSSESDQVRNPNGTFGALKEGSE